MVIRGREGLEIVMSLDGSGVLRLGVSDCSSILCQLAIHDIISNVSSEEESLVGGDGISSEGRSLEQVEEGPRMERLLSIVQSDLGILIRQAGQERRAKLQLDAPGNLIVELDLGVERIGGGPALGQGDAALGVLALEFAGDGAYARVRVRCRCGWGVGGLPTLGSWLPLTVNWTPLGVFVLTSSLVPRLISVNPSRQHHHTHLR